MGSCTTTMAQLANDALANADPAELREQLKVLLEQEQLVADYVESAAKARKFEDAKTLKKSHDELCREILRIQRRLALPAMAADAL